MPIDATRARTCSSTRPLRDHRRIQEHLPRQRSYLFDVPSDMVDVLSDLEVIRLLAVPWIRAETTAGISSKGRITGRGIRNPEMEPLCPEIASYSSIQGTDPRAA